MSNLTLLIPAKFESESLPIFLEELKSYDYKKLIILDERDIKTIDSIKPFENIEILNQKKSGYGNALIEGINHVKTDFYIFTSLGKVFFNLKISDILYTYLIGKTEIIKKLDLISGDFSFCVELPIKVQRKNYKYDTYPCYERKRIAGKKKVNPFLDGFKILLSMVNLFLKR